MVVRFRTAKDDVLARGSLPTSVSGWPECELVDDPEPGPVRLTARNLRADAAVTVTRRRQRKFAGAKRCRLSARRKSWPARCKVDKKPADLFLARHDPAVIHGKHGFALIEGNQSLDVAGIHVLDEESLQVIRLPRRPAPSWTAQCGVRSVANCRPKKSSAFQCGRRSPLATSSPSDIATRAKRSLPS